MAEVTFNLDDETEGFVKEFCEKSGVDFNTLMNVYCKQIALRKKIPFEIGISEKKEMDYSFESIKKIDPELLIKNLIDEDEYIIAVFLASLDPAKSAVLLQNIEDEDLRFRVVKRMLKGVSVSTDILKGIDKYLCEKIECKNKLSCLNFNGVEDFTEIINLVDRSCEKGIIENLEENMPDVAEEVKKHMFVFEDIVMLDDRSIQKLLREVDQQELAKALKGEDDEVCNKIFNNMSKRAGDMLKEDMEFMGPVRVADVEEAQEKIVAIIRRLEDCGDIVIARCAEDELIG